MNNHHQRCYEIAVNSLIPKASEIATMTATGSRREVGVDGQEFEWCTWTEIFHKEMNRLCRETGLR
jgi:hypothetical protein